MQRTDWLKFGLFVLLVNQSLHWLIIRFVPQAVSLNDRALFGLIGSPWGIAAVISAGIVFFGFSIVYASVKKTQLVIAVLLIGAGALSNLLDRLWYGGVIDYIPLLSISVFNLPDVEIVLGTILLVLDIRLNKKMTP